MDLKHCIPRLGLAPLAPLAPLAQRRHVGECALVLSFAAKHPASKRNLSGTMRSPSSPLSEFELIARYFAPLAQGTPGAYGLLDDAAVISPSSGNELVVKTDTIVAGIDFPPDTAPDLIARKALRVNLSDLAAKGARPCAYLLDLVLPRAVDEAWVAAFAAGLAADQKEYGVSLIGGDMSSTSGPVVIAVSALGEAPIGRIIRRGGARAGDLVFVTGTIGDAALGLRVLQGALPGLDADSAAFLLERYRLPQPRVSLGPQLIGLATASIDVSDGLIADLRHLCSVASLDAIVTALSVPLSAAARAAIDGGLEVLARALTGGDDYELLFTAPQASFDRLNELARATGVPITRIGQMTAPSDPQKPRVLVLDEQRRPLDVGPEGWTHFA
jgi:thiamine-monophosphate kinase